MTTGLINCLRNTLLYSNCYLPTNIACKFSKQVLASAQCGCLDYDLTQGDDYITVMNTMSFVPQYLADFDEDTQRRVVSALCSGLVNDGDHLQVSLHKMRVVKKSSVIWS